MLLKEILVVLEAGQNFDAPLAMAAGLAQRHGGLVSGVCLARESALDSTEAYVGGKGGALDVFTARDRAFEAASESARKAFDRDISLRCLSGGWRVGTLEDWSSSVVRQARLSDLVILSHPNQDRAMTRTIESVVLGAGVPCVLVPAAAVAPHTLRRVALAWKDTREAARALRDGLDFLKGATDVAILTVEDDHAVADETRMGELLHFLDRHGIVVEVKPVAPRANPGAALLDACADFAADLLVMGAYGRTRASEALLGGVTRTVLADATLPVLMSH